MAEARVTGIARRLSEALEERFGALPAALVRAPGRVNLIGEHTDYNDGFVLPMAIDRAVWIALRPRSDRTVVVRALDYQQQTTFQLAALERGREVWAEYLKGVAWALQQSGLELRGWEGVLAGDVPRGAGLSSSAALELATARAFQVASAFPWEPVRMARLCQQAENRWVGMASGIMDQLISAGGRQGYALLIDCRSLATTAVPLPAATAVVVLDTGTRRGLVDSAYNERRAQCEEVARRFGVPALRDVTLEELEVRTAELDELGRKRARHVISENARTREAAAAMKRGDAARLGELMNASHESLRKDFEVSSSALDAMVACARAQAGCLGARMTGAGFGGCAVALVQESAVADFSAGVAACYQRNSGRHPEVYVCRATSGAAVIG